jgi:hypothetical protein
MLTPEHKKHKYANWRSITMSDQDVDFFNDITTVSLNKNYSQRMMTGLTEVSKNDFQESFQNLHGHWQKCVTTQGN